MKAKKILTGILTGMIALGVSFGTQAATRDEIAAITVSKSGNFKYWTQNSEVKQKLVEYVKDVTNKNSKNFIPVEDRVAVFDVDGTLIAETTPSYFEWMLYLDRALYDKNYTPSPEDREHAKIVEAAIIADNRLLSFPHDVMKQEAISQESVFAGMTNEEYENYLKKFMETPADGLTNLKRGESFYLPMVEIVKYLQANNFSVWLVSGTDRQLLRVVGGDLLKIKSDNVIGTDIHMRAANQGDKDGLDYTYRKGDSLVRGEFVQKNLQMNKVSLIFREIGKQPVLAFGNSGSDASMLNYAINGNKHKALAFMVICDDTEREFGNLKKAEKCTKLAGDNGWLTISMKNDFKTIYGDNVKRDK